MAVINFGMDLRPTSQVVKTDDELRNELSAKLASIATERSGYDQQRQDAATSFGQARLQAARDAGLTGISDDYSDLVRGVLLDPRNGSGLFSKVAENQGLSGAEIAAFDQFNRANGSLGALGGQSDAVADDYSKLIAQRSMSQQSQQQAYDRNMLSGGQPGGVLSGIAQQGTLDPTQMASWGTSWTQPGFGNPGSLGGLGGYGGKTSQPQQNGGWGGVFGNRNPWSAA